MIDRVYCKKSFLINGVMRVILDGKPDFGMSVFLVQVIL